MKSWLGLSRRGVSSGGGLREEGGAEGGGTHVGRIHFGMASYVSGDGDTIQRMTYQKTYMDAKEVKL